MISAGALFGAVAMGSAMQGANQLGSTWFSNYLGRKNEKKSLARQFAYAQAYALNNPSWTVQGLRNANLNPILAATDGAFSSPTVPNVGYNSPSASPGSVPDFINAMINNKAAKATADLQASQESLNYVRAMNEMKNMGFTGNSAVAARLFSELTGKKLDTPASKQAFENFWNSAQPNNVSLGKSNPIDTPTPSHETKSIHHPSEILSREIADREDREFDKAFGLDKSSLWQKMRNKERLDRERHDRLFEDKYGPKQFRYKKGLIFTR